MLEIKSKQLSAKIKGSKNRYRARKIVARLHQKISNQRQDFHFKLANNLIHKYDHLFFEDLNLDAINILTVGASTAGLDRVTRELALASVAGVFIKLCHFKNHLPNFSLSGK